MTGTARNIASTKSAGDIESLAHRADHARRNILAGLGLLAALGFILALSRGAMQIPAAAILDLLWNAVAGGGTGGVEETVLLSIRLPRAILTVLTGAALGMAGAVLQGLFRNPLADPGLIGISSGAALAAAMVIVLGGLLPVNPLGAILPYLLPLAAFGGSLAATVLVYRLARIGSRTDVGTLLLGGVALNAIAGAGLGFLIFASTDQQLRDLNFWLLGSLAGATWRDLLIVLPLILVPLVWLPRLGRALNAILIGEAEAEHLGYATESVKRQAVVLVALAVGAAVSLTGIIGFVGLVVPHILRLLAGADHRMLLPASALLGAVLLLVADLLARTLVLPAELPIGVITSAVGGPFFFWLLLRRKWTQGVAR